MLKLKELELWTSKLEYSGNIEKVIEITIKDLKDKIIFHEGSKTTEFIDITLPSMISDPKNYAYADKENDYTCIAKGYFISYVLKHLPEPGMEYFINFGGDMAFNLKDEHFVPLKYTNFLFSTKKSKTIFCSTNIERGCHIPNAEFNYTIALADDPVISDFVATKALAGDKKWMRSALRFDFEDKLVNKTYIASPFFCETDIEIRDKMIEGFANYIRPDLLNPNIEGNLNKDKELARKIRKDNLTAIDECECLVFPKNTTDLGTLFEVGYAIRRSKLVIRFDYATNSYEVISTNLPKIDFTKKYTLDLNKLGAGVILGYFYDYPENFKYFLGSSRDNIMLMNNEEVKHPTELYPSYLPNILSQSVYRLNTLTSGS